MTKQEFISKIRECKCCHSKKAIRCNFSLNDDLEIVAFIECQNCHNNECGTNPIHVLASWNAKNHTNEKQYIVVIQHKENPTIVLQFRYTTESISEISLVLEKEHPDFEILSIKEIVS